jgi:8-oxo-dGTP diphosphatase
VANTQHDSETPAHGQQVVTVCALIHDVLDGVPKVFMPKRSDTKKFLPGVYNLPGGHVDFGEDLVIALKREIQEEFGLDISVGDPFAAFTYTNDVKGSHSAEIVYFAKFSSPLSEMRMDKEDHSGFQWVGQADVPSVYSSLKGENDDEWMVLRRGLDLLNGGGLSFG